MRHTNEEKKAIALLEKKGYKIKYVEPIGYGCIVESKSDGCAFLITVFDPEGGEYQWGGIQMGEHTGGTEPMWVDAEAWEAGDEYKIIGKVDLSRWIKPAKP